MKLKISFLQRLLFLLFTSSPVLATAFNFDVFSSDQKFAVQMEMVRQGSKIATATEYENFLNSTYLRFLLYFDGNRENVSLKQAKEAMIGLSEEKLERVASYSMLLDQVLQYLEGHYPLSSWNKRTTPDELHHSLCAIIKATVLLRGKTHEKQAPLFFASTAPYGAVAFFEHQTLHFSK